jgi:hypothetical protein
VKLGGANNGVYHSSSHIPQTTAARAAGLSVGHYWFNGRDGSVADQVQRIIGAGIPTGEMLWWDVEAEGSDPAWSPAEVAAAAKALNDAGIPYSRQGIYMSSGLTRSQNWTPVVDLGLRLWVADYGTNDGSANSMPLVGYWKDVALWQFTSVGRLPGYDGNLDLNFSGHEVWTVFDLQGALNALINAGLITDGIPGPKTTAAIIKFQESVGLTPDGIAGRLTLTAIADRLD